MRLSTNAELQRLNDNQIEKRAERCNPKTNENGTISQKCHEGDSLVSERSENQTTSIGFDIPKIDSEKSESPNHMKVAVLASRDNTPTPMQAGCPTNPFSPNGAFANLPSVPQLCLRTGLVIDNTICNGLFDFSCICGTGLNQLLTVCGIGIYTDMVQAALKNYCSSWSGPVPPQCYASYSLTYIGPTLTLPISTIAPPVTTQAPSLVPSDPQPPLTTDLLPLPSNTDPANQPQPTQDGCPIDPFGPDGAFGMLPTIPKVCVRSALVIDHTICNGVFDFGCVCGTGADQLVALCGVGAYVDMVVAALTSYCSSWSGPVPSECYASNSFPPPITEMTFTSQTVESQTLTETDLHPIESENSNTDLVSRTGSEIPSGTDNESQTGTDIGSYTGTDNESQTGTDNESQTGTDNESQTGTDIVSYTGTDNESQTGTDNGPATNTESQSGTDDDPGTNTESLSGTDDDPGTNTNSQFSTDDDSGTNTDLLTGTDTVSPTGTDNASNANTDTVSNMGTNSISQSEDPDTGSMQQPNQSLSSVGTNINSGGIAQPSITSVPPGYDPGQSLPSGYISGQPLPSGYMSGQQLPSGYKSGQLLPSGYMSGQQLSSGYKSGQSLPSGYVSGQQLSSGYKPGQLLPSGNMSGQQLPSGYDSGHTIPLNCKNGDCKDTTLGNGKSSAPQISLLNYWELSLVILYGLMLL